MKISSNFLNGITIPDFPISLSTDFIDIVTSKFPFNLLEDKEDLFDNQWFTNTDSFSPPAHENSVVHKAIDTLNQTVDNTHDHDHDHDEHEHEHTFEFQSSATTNETTGSAIVTNASGLLETYTSGLGYMGVLSDFNITVKFIDSEFWTTTAQKVVTQVAEYFSTLITVDRPDINGVDDIEIEVHIGQLDSGIAGQGGWIALRGDGTPYRGGIRIDQDYIDHSITDSIVIHEFLHAMGAGTVWSRQGLTETTSDGVNRFTGENATLVYNYGEYSNVALNDSYSLSGAPIDSNGAHWTSTFLSAGNDVFAPRVSSSSYFSTMTLASLEDIGYDTIFDANDLTATFIQFDDFVASLPEGPNGLPVAVDDNLTTNEDEVLTGNVLLNDYDPDGDAISVVAGTIGTLHGGVVAIQVDGSFEYTPALDFYGEDSFTYTLEDALGARSTGTVTINVLPVNDYPDNNAPVANDDNYIVDEDTVLTGNVLDNDIDPDGDTLSVIEQIIQTINKGTVELYGDGSFTYTPFKDYNGEDSFNYTVTDGKEGQSTGTVNIMLNPVDEPSKGNKGGGKPDKGGDGTDTGGGGNGHGKGGKKSSASLIEENTSAATLEESSATAFLKFDDVLSQEDSLSNVLDVLSNLPAADTANDLPTKADIGLNHAQETLLSIVETGTPHEEVVSTIDMI